MTESDTPIETRIDEEVHHLLQFMNTESTYTDEYKSMFTQLTKVMELRLQESTSEKANAIKLQDMQQQLAQHNSITKEAWLTVGTHVAGLIVLMNHERAHVIASKAFGFVKKIF
jgi:hypothetical protein